MSSIEQAPLPVTYQDVSEYYAKAPGLNPFDLRRTTFQQIEMSTGRPLLCYVTKDNKHPSRIASFHQ